MIKKLTPADYHAISADTKRSAPKPIRLARNKLVTQAVRQHPDKVEALVISCGFITMREFMEACKSNRLLTVPDVECQRVRECYALLQQHGLLITFWAMFRAWRASEARPVEDYTHPSENVWQAHHTTVTLDSKDHNICIENKNGLDYTAYFVNYSWTPLCRGMSQAEHARIMRIIANSGMRRAVECAIAERSTSNA